MGSSTMQAVVGLSPVAALAEGYWKGVCSVIAAIARPYRRVIVRGSFGDPTPAEPE